MNVSCKKCGEVLYGAVNRCWKCGTDIEVVIAPKIPPIRRSPVNLNPSPTTVAIGSVTDSAKQILPWFLNMELSEEVRHRFAIASAGIGAIGCILGITSGWTVIFGVIGIACGLVAMASKKRELATMGLVLSVIALFLGFSQIAFSLWTQYSSQRWIEELQGIQQ